VTTPTSVRELIARDANWLRTLETVYKIKVSRDGSLASLKYDQIESPMHDPLVQECRGMVVDVDRGMILAHPYNKFWNHGEEGAAAIDWRTARVQEKLDGSLMILWWSPIEMRWRVSSSGHPTAGGEFGYDVSRTFADAFWQTFEALGMRHPPLYGLGNTFMLELCAKENRIVVRHDRPRLVLHGARDMETGLEIARDRLAELATEVGWELVKEYPIATIEDCLAAAEALDPVATEGFVVVDANFNRVKVKSPRYVMLHHMRGEGMSQRRAIEIWQSGETAEVLANFPEFTPEVENTQGAMRQAIEDAYRLWKDNARRPTKKEFALVVKEQPGAAIAFKLWDKALCGVDPALEDATSIVRTMTVPAIQRLIGSQP
jgi:hypothetical protein